MPPSFAIAFHRAASVTRAALYETPNDPQLPLNLRADAVVPFLGFCGTGYKKGGVVIFGINPGGGGDAYASRTPQDNELIPLIERFVVAEASAADSAFEVMCTNYSAQVQRWNLWRILSPTLEACRTTIDNACYLNLFPYRTAKDAKPSSRALRVAWRDVVAPLLEALEPSRLVALGKKAGGIAERLHTAPPPLYVVPRTIGDTYVSADAKQVLAAIRESAA